MRVSSVTMFRPTFWVADAWQTRLTSSHGTERSLAHKLPTSTPDELALDPLQHDGSAAQAYKSNDVGEPKSVARIHPPNHTTDPSP